MGTPAYDKANTTRVNLKLNNKTDDDIIRQLRKVDSIQGYIKSLIRADMKKGEQKMSIYEFVKGLFDACDVTPEKMDLSTAGDDLERFSREGWDLPDGITADDYMSTWNELVDEQNRVWYAVQRDPEDDWSTGSYDRAEAIRMAKKQIADYPETLIAVIDNSTSNPVCVDEIREF